MSTLQGPLIRLNTDSSSRQDHCANKTALVTLVIVPYCDSTLVSADAFIEKGSVHVNCILAWQRHYQG